MPGRMKATHTYSQARPSNQPRCRGEEGEGGVAATCFGSGCWCSSSGDSLEIISAWQEAGSSSSQSASFQLPHAICNGMSFLLDSFLVLAPFQAGQRAEPHCQASNMFGRWLHETAFACSLNGVQARCFSEKAVGFVQLAQGLVQRSLAHLPGSLIYREPRKAFSSLAASKADQIQLRLGRAMSY